MSSDTDWKQTAAKVAEELLSHMTLTQKLNQLSGTFIQSLDHVRGNRNGSGALSIMTSCAVPEEMRRSCSQLTEQFSCHSRRKIAPLIHCEALSGPMMRGYALFPAPLGIGASFDPVLNEQTADVTAWNYMKPESVSVCSGFGSGKRFSLGTHGRNLWM